MKFRECGTDASAGSQGKDLFHRYGFSQWLPTLTIEHQMFSHLL